MKDPLTGLPILDFQSTKRQWPFGMAFGPESTEMYDELIGPNFLDFFSGDNVVCPECTDADGRVHPELSNFKVVAPQDMKSQWTTTGCGSAGGELGCLACMCKKGD